MLKMHNDEIQKNNKYKIIANEDTRKVFRSGA